MKLWCSRCEQEKPDPEFNKGQVWCKQCHYEYSKEHRAKNKEHYNARLRKWSSTAEQRLKQLLRAKTSGDRSALDFDVMYKRLEDNNFCCEVTGIPFTFDGRSPTSMSIHRIDPKGGYVYNNVQIICWWVNTAAGDWGIEKLKELIRESTRLL